MTTRDVGSRFFPAVSGAALQYDNMLLSFFTGIRASSIGYFPNELQFGLGRNVYNDDQKGLPDGT